MGCQARVKAGAVTEPRRAPTQGGVGVFQVLLVNEAVSVLIHQCKGLEQAARVSRGTHLLVLAVEQGPLGVSRLPALGFPGPAPGAGTSGLRACWAGAEPHLLELLDLGLLEVGEDVGGRPLGPEGTPLLLLGLPAGL